MSGTEIWSWWALFALGAFHGINPGMGWLFAVALGMQEQRRGAVWGAMIPLGVGHALAVALALLVALAAETVVPGHVRPMARRAPAGSLGHLPIGPPPAPPLGLDAGRYETPHRVVLLDGHSPRRRIDGAAHISAHDCDGPDRWRSRRASRPRRDGSCVRTLCWTARHFGPWRRLSQCDRSCCVDRVRKAGRWVAAAGLD